MPYTHQQPVSSFISTVVGPDLYIITAGAEGNVRVWKFLPTGSFEHAALFEGHIRGVTSMVLQGIWTLPRSASSSFKYELSYVFMYLFNFGHLGPALWTSSMDRSIRVWNLSTMSAAGALTAATGGHTEGVTCLELFSLDEEYIASGGADTFVKLWSPKGDLLWSDSQGAIVTALKSSQDKSGIYGSFTVVIDASD